MSVQIPLFEKVAPTASKATASVEEIVGERFDVKKFVENFAALAAANGGLQNLREMVLALAVRGLLVPQIGDEEPFDAALGRLLRASEKCKDDPKREKELRSGLGTPPESPWLVPPRWRFVRLEETCVGGGLFSDGDWVESKDQDPNGTVRLTQLADVGDGIWRDRSNRYMNRHTADRLRCTFLDQGDILIARMPDPIGRACVFPGDAKTCATVVDVAVLRIRDDFFDRRYVMTAINSRLVRDQIQTMIAGTTRQRISRSNLATVAIPLPPLAEQKRIVAKVDQLMALCDELEARQTKTRAIGTRLTKSALEALTTAEGPADFDAAWRRVVDNFDVLVDRAEKLGDVRARIVELAMRGKLTRPVAGDQNVAQVLATHEREFVQAPRRVDEDKPFDVPPTWAWVRWGTVSAGTSSGWSPQCENRPREGEEWGVLKVSAVSWLKFQPDQNKALPSTLAPRPEFAVRANDFLMSRANTAQLVGRSVVVDEAPERLLLSDKLIRCEFCPLVDKRYVNLFTRTTAAREHFLRHASGTSDTMKNISREAILSMPLPLPPLEEQRRIVARVGALMRICDELEVRLVRVEERAVRLTEAALGELVA